jgi:hypothetical protein
VEGSRFSTPVAGQVEDERDPHFALAISAPARPDRQKRPVHAQV